MPELVEVENYRRLLLTLKSPNPRSLLSIELPSSSNPKNFPTKDDFDTIQKCRLKDVERKGKLLRMVLDQSDSKNGMEQIHLYLHMGMTGRISTHDVIPSLESLTDTETFPPPYTYLILKSNGEKVAYSDPRKFGGICLGEPLKTQWNEFAVDALSPKASLEKIIDHKKGIKNLLLDQRAVISGVGNWIADEVLYQSKIHPDQNYLRSEEVDVLKDSLDRVLNTGIQCLLDNKTFPANWIFHRRWSKGKEGIQKDANGKVITFLQSSGRTSLWCYQYKRKNHDIH